MDNIWEKYKKLEIIGNLSYADVYRAKNNLTKEYVIIKEIKKIKINDDSYKNIKKEKEIIQKLKSENIVSLIEIIETQDSYFIVSELCYMSLEEYIEKRNDPLSIDELREFLLELNKGFKEMNDNNIIHKNLKLSNILLSLNKERIDKTCFKISNFRMSKLLEEELNGNPITIAPEVLKRETNLISSKSDIWSLGVIIYYLLFKEYPYNGGEYNIIKQIESKKKLNNIYSKELDDLIKKMLNPNINERISWENYFEHSFFKNNSKLNLPLFKMKCEIHSKKYNAYCSLCKHNICESCLKDHSSNKHNIILFSQIGLSQNEIKQFNNIMKNIESNLNKLSEIKNEINQLINHMKLIKDNSSIYDNDEENNFKYYYLQFLNIIKNKLKLEENIIVPEIGMKINKKVPNPEETKEKKNNNINKWELMYF